MIKQKKTQRGIVLVITLLVLVVMSLASLAMIKVMDTSTLVVGNFASRSAGNAAMMPPIEESIKELTEAFTLDPESLWGLQDKSPPAQLAAYYSPTYDEQKDDKNGIPDKLLSASVETGIKESSVDEGGNITRVMIQRLCPNTGEYDEQKNACVGIVPDDGQTPPCVTGDCLQTYTIKSAIKVSYRITVRVDGPKQSQAFAQAIINL